MKVPFFFFQGTPCMLDNKKSFEILNIWKRKEIREKFESWKKKKNSITIMLLVFTGRKQTHTDSFPLKTFSGTGSYKEMEGKRAREIDERD